MRFTGAARQMAGLVAMISAGGTLSVIALAVHLQNSSARAQATLAWTGASNKKLFALVSAASDMQTASQQLVRTRDIDVIKKLVNVVREAESVAQMRMRQEAAESPVTASLRALTTAHHAVTETMLRGDNATAQQLLVEQCDPAFDRMLNEVAKELSQVQDNGTRDMAALAQRNKNIECVTYIALLAWLLLGPFGSTMVIRRLSRALASISNQLSQGADQMASAAQQVSSASQTLAQSTSQQASAFERTSASSESIHSITHQNAERSREAAVLMGDTWRVVDDANQRLDRMVSSMRHIGQSSQKISKIIQVIEEIAFQTNLLALNAAVEAARAGSSGMGFAVVADEVRTLAQRCAQAARDTTPLIEESLAHANAGGSHVDQVVEAFRSITRMTENAKALVDQVTSATRDQAGGVTQIATAITEMKSITLRNAATAEQSAAAGEELSAQSEALRGVVDSLHLVIDGSSRSNTARA